MATPPYGSGLHSMNRFTSSTERGYNCYRAKLSSRFSSFSVRSNSDWHLRSAARAKPQKILAPPSTSCSLSPPASPLLGELLLLMATCTASKPHPWRQLSTSNRAPATGGASGSMVEPFDSELRTYKCYQ